MRGLGGPQELTIVSEPGLSAGETFYFKSAIRMSVAISGMRYAHCYVGLRPFPGIGNRGVTAQLIVGDSRNTITLARSSADVSPPYGFMLLPGTTSSGFAMKRSSFSLSHTKSAPFMALE